MTDDKNALQDKVKPSSNSARIIDFGTRKISRQNFSRIVALPKLALLDRGHEATHVNVKLVELDGEKFIKLTPIKIGDENDE